MEGILFSLGDDELEKLDIVIPCPDYFLDPLVITPEQISPNTNGAQEEEEDKKIIYNANFSLTKHK